MSAPSTAEESARQWSRGLQWSHVVGVLGALQEQLAAVERADADPDLDGLYSAAGLHRGSPGAAETLALLLVGTRAPNADQALIVQCTQDEALRRLVKRQHRHYQDAEGWRAQAARHPLLTEHPGPGAPPYVVPKTYAGRILAFLLAGLCWNDKAVAFGVARDRGEGGRPHTPRFVRMPLYDIPGALLLHWSSLWPGAPGPRGGRVLCAREDCGLWQYPDYLLQPADHASLAPTNVRGYKSYEYAAKLPHGPAEDAEVTHFDVAAAFAFPMAGRGGVPKIIERD